MKIVFFGTSITKQNPEYGKTFVDLIEKEYLKLEIDNFGIGGANSSQVLQQVKNNNTKNYDITFIEMGINDILRKYQNRGDEYIGINQYIINYKESLIELSRISKKVICISCPAVSDKFEFSINKEIESYNVAVKNLCNSMNIEYIDIYSGFENSDVNLWYDGLHPNEKGCKIIVDKVLEFI